MSLFLKGLGLVSGLLACAACIAADPRPDGNKTTSGRAVESAASSHQGLDSGLILRSYGKLPMAFEKNHGQADDAVDFVARGAGYRVLLMHSEAVVDLAGSPLEPALDTLRMRFVGARRDAAVAGIDPLPGKTSYFRGSDSSRHLGGIESFAQVR